MSDCSCFKLLLYLQIPGKPRAAKPNAKRRPPDEVALPSHIANSIKPILPELTDNRASSHGCQ